MADNPTVVIVDQNLENRAELPRILQLAGISIVGDASFGIEATTVVAESRPQFVLLGLEEPTVRGLQAMDAIAEVAPQSPIIVYSSLIDGASIRKAMLAGARDYLAAPLTAATLLASIRAIQEQEATRERRLSGERSERGTGGTVITLFGAKGGIGKTTIATNLATALYRETGDSVVIVDMDTRFGDVAVMMDMPSERTITEAARDHEKLDRTNIRDYLHNHPAGVSVLPAPQNPADWEMIGPEPIEKIVRVLAQTFNYVILDTPGTFNEIVGISLELATVVLLITSMDVASIKDTVMALNMLRAWSFPEEKIKLLVNHSNIANSIRETDVARTLDYEIFWQIPFDAAVSRAGQIGQPVILSSPRSKVSQNLAELARAIGGVRQAPSKARGGAFASVSRIFRR
ncbi:MAG TPA: P-loop NTPase [Dehalococcoidia bacterium]|nr:P-loop NTPase [Dehalococcoidia bacterium]